MIKEVTIDYNGISWSIVLQSMALCCLFAGL